MNPHPCQRPPEDHVSQHDELITNALGLVVEVVGSTTHHLDVAPDAALDAITDIPRLPDWNAAIESVIEAPDELRPRSSWVVMMHPRGWPRWRSRSTVDQLDRDTLRFAYTTQTDDGNPSRATWTWQVTPSAAGSRVSVSWHLWPRTIGRRSVVARLRRPMLQREVRASLHALDTTIRHGFGPTP